MEILSPSACDIKRLFPSACDIEKMCWHVQSNSSCISNSYSPHLNCTKINGSRGLYLVLCMHGSSPIPLQTLNGNELSTIVVWVRCIWACHTWNSYYVLSTLHCISQCGIIKIHINAPTTVHSWMHLRHCACTPLRHSMQCMKCTVIWCTSQWSCSCCFHVHVLGLLPVPWMFFLLYIPNGNMVNTQS